MQKSITQIQHDFEKSKYRKYGDQKSKPVVSKTHKKCYNCGQAGHFQSECRRNDRSKSSKRAYNTKASSEHRVAQGNARSGISKQTGDAGLFVNAKVGNQALKLLIDTGATVSIISKCVYEQLCDVDSNENTLSKVKRSILSANNEPLNVYGERHFDIELGSMLHKHKFIVADVTVQGVIGLDFMTKYDCVIDIVHGIMTLGTRKVDLIQEGHFGCFRVAVADTVNIPPRSEIVTLGNVCLLKGELAPNGVGLIEPEDKFLHSDRALVAKSLVNKGETVPLRLMNPTTDVKVVRAGTIVASLSPVEQIIEPAQNEQKRDNKVLTPELQQMLSKIKGLSRTQKQKVKNLILRNSTLFAKSDKDLGRTDVVKHKIDTGKNKPIKQSLRRVPVHLRNEVNKQMDDMLERNVIEPSSSPWSSGIVLVQKKDGSTRFCVDYRRLNAATIKDAYPLPRIDESLDHLSGACWFSTLDLCSGFWQVEMEPEDKPKTAFVTNRGLYQFRVMPFGLCNAPATFERLMETVLFGLQWDICLIYMDDIIVFGKSFEDMLKNLDVVFSRLAAAGLKLKAKKSNLFAKQVEFLGHLVSDKGVSTDPRKIQIIKDWQEPTNVAELRSFLGLCSYYRKFIKNFASVAKPLHKLTEKGKKFVWSTECQHAFELLKAKLTDTPILTYPDFSKPFILDTDASDQSIGAVLSQR